MVSKTLNSSPDNYNTFKSVVFNALFCNTFDLYHFSKDKCWIPVDFAY